MQIYVFILIFAGTCHGCSIFKAYCNSLISKHYNRDYNSNAAYDDSGELPYIALARKALEFSSTIVAIKTNNSTLLSCLALNSTEFGSAIGRNTLTSLGGRIYIFSTGFVGDSNILLKTAKRFVADHQYEFGICPSGWQVAQQLAKILQEHTRLPRPLSCHLFIVDNSHVTSKRGSSSIIYELDPSGIIQTVAGGMAGRGAADLKQYLSDNYRPNICLRDSKSLAERLVQKANFENFDSTTGTVEVDHYEIFD